MLQSDIAELPWAHVTLLLDKLGEPLDHCPETS
jgi:hypothetical protein